MKMSLQEQELLHSRLNMETAQMPWRELQRYFASGCVIVVADALDMVQVAVMMAADDSAGISELIEQKQMGKVTDEQALAWFEADVSLWTVVVRPWILVQVKKQATAGGVLLN